MGLRTVGDALGDLVLGARCAGCSATALGLCRTCRRMLGALRPVPVTPVLPGFPATWVAGEYRDRLRAVILATKEHGALGQLPLLGSLLARAVAQLLLAAPATRTPILLAPVPSVPSRVAARGLDLTGDLARRAALRLRRHALGATVVRAIRLTRQPIDQAELGRAERVRNMQDAFSWRPVGTGSLVVVDDVVTTGATLAAVAAAARAVGVELLGAAALAHTARRGGSESETSAPRTA